MNRYLKQALASFVFSVYCICIADALYMGIENVQWLLNLLVGLVATVIVMAIIIISEK